MEAERGRYTTNQGFARRRLGLSRLDFRRAIHRIKLHLSDKQDLLIDTATGDAFDRISNEPVGNLLDELGRGRLTP